ncbi:winged helix-turn-helix transcriptional regulator [Desulfosarcina ovata]|uniref:Uncharacterized protein n=2 Tax=Desulfosarcina ovata TaxID=83564 RepID=A0A5K8A582_9BACT|nr:winged helix-turn-helix transcriptional regulator [Desulfosarcina ovata]BBO80299.1 hypothetical protein DSCO28_08650 [Desulfosarcina ovata subsp. sediminis]BBO87689.1 hypothetical protein DSCOOX_08690 [Desulfosarcina ovata subsp. ovata]
MEINRLKTLSMLEMIAEDEPRSQREFSDSLNVSLGLVNAVIKRLVNKGYCKVKTLSRNRLKYILTPAGATEKTRLVYEYITSSYQSYKAACTRLQSVYDNLEAEGIRRVLFYGAGEFCDIAFMALNVTRLEIVGVVDPLKAGEQYANQIVKPVSKLPHLDFDVLLVTMPEDPERVRVSIEKMGLPSDKIRFFD